MANPSETTDYYASLLERVDSAVSNSPMTSPPQQQFHPITATTESLWDRVLKFLLQTYEMLVYCLQKAIELGAQAVEMAKSKMQGGTHARNNAVPLRSDMGLDTEF